MKAKLFSTIALLTSVALGTACSSGSKTATPANNTGGPETTVACTLSSQGNTTCDTQNDIPASGVTTANAECANSGGTPSAHCPTANLIGCCVTQPIGDAASATQTSCYYSSAEVPADAGAGYEGACTLSSGTWTTTVP